jgi:archaellum biogenesis ATPase FlaH
MAGWALAWSGLPSRDCEGSGAVAATAAGTSFMCPQVGLLASSKKDSVVARQEREMAEPGGGRSGRLADEDEFDKAFARLTAPWVEVSVPDLTRRPGAPPPAIQTSAVSAPGMRTTDEPLLEAPESAVREAPAKTPPRPDLDAPAQDERPAVAARGAQSMRSALGAALPSARRVPARPPSEGLRFLFPPPQASSDRPPLEEPLANSEHSPYYRTFVRNAAHRGHVMSSGYERLDGLLEGGFHPGLYLLSGHRERMRRAFLDNLVWGAVEQRRPICYYALDTGTQAVWERMIVTLGSFLGVSVLPEELRASTGVDDVAVRVGRVDAALVRNVLPHVWLLDPVGMDDVNSHRFMTVLDAWLSHADSPRLLIIDSLVQLFPLLVEDTVQAVRLLDELDRLLRRRSAAVVATVSVDPDAQLLDVVRGQLRLAEFGGSEDATTEIVVVTAHDEGRVRSEVFAVDAMTGLFG